MCARRSHIIDVGGIGYTPDATDVHMEGLYVPMLKLMEEGVFAVYSRPDSNHAWCALLCLTDHSLCIDTGQRNETLFAMIRRNTRQVFT